MLRTALLVICSATLLTARGQQFSAYKPLNSPEAANVQDVAAGDLNGDGLPDIVIGTYGGWVNVYFNEGGGTFGPAIRLAEGMGRVYQVLLVDFDNDGDLDVTYAAWGTPNAGWFRNLGGGSFGPLQSLVDDLQANTASSLAWADVNADGHLDIFLSSYINNTVAWYRNNGNQVFGPRQGIVNCTQAWVCAATDMDGDGDIDIVVAGDGVSWRDNQNSQFMGSPPYNGGTIATGLNDVRGLVLRDNGDGFPDIYVAEQGNDRVLRYSNNGTGNYSLLGTMTEFATNVPGVGTLRLLDLNGDGITEIVAACSGDHTIRRLTGSGSGSVVVSGVMGASGMAVADFNGDGFPDLVTIAASASQVAVFAGNGSFQFTPMTTLNEVAGSVSVLAISDVDGDGLKDIVESFSGAQVLGWKRNLGDEQFGPVQVIDDAAPGVQRFLMRDMDNDGDPDIIASFYLDRMAWYRNSGTGVFTGPLPITDQFGPRYEFDTGDFDGDGDLDLAAAQSGSGNNVRWYRNSGNGVLGSPVVVSAGQTNVRWLISTDVNADGADEVIFFRTGTGTMICMNDGAGNFSAPAVVDNGLTTLYDLRSAHLNADTWPDLVLLRQSSAVPMITLLGNGDGTFTAADTAGAGEGIMYGTMDIADMDGDGDLDLVAAATNLNYLYKWFENDGTGHFPISYRIDTGYTAGGWAAGDLDGDGDPDVLTVHAEELRWYESFISSRYSVSGLVFHDQDENGSWTPGEVGLPYSVVLCEPSASVPYTGADGNYRFTTDSGTYTLIAPPPHPWWVQNTSPATFQVTLTDVEPEADNADIGFIAAFDTLVVLATSTAAPVRCDRPYMRWIDLVNIGSLDAQVQLEYVPQEMETLLSSYPAPDQVVGGTYRWNSTVPVFSSLHIALMAEIDGTPPQMLTDSLYAQITAPGQTLIRTMTQTRPVLCAFDPNDKQVEPVGYGEFGAIDIATERLTYTVRFQNTGTDTAFVVMVRDRLNERLDRSSIQVLGSSHSLTSLNVENDGEAVFLFDNILLPDSNVNEPASHGYVVFSIGVLPGAPEGTTIENNVDIYFGGNEAVRTNTVMNTLVDCSHFGAAITGLDGGTLMASPGAHYQWFLNGEPLAGDTLQMIFISAQGTYTVHVTNTFGCEALSNPLAVISTSIADAEGIRMAIVPNPVDDMALLVFSTVLPTDAMGIVMNASGAVVQRMSLGGLREYALQRGELAAGLYLLHVHSGGRQLITRRFIVR